MRFDDFLAEKLTASTYQNDDKTLTLIPELVKKDFKLEFHGFSVSGACMISQIVYNIEAVTGIPAKDITDSFETRWLQDFQGMGKTLKEIFSHVESSVIKKDDGYVKVKLGASVHHSVSSVLADIAGGLPVIFIVTAKPDGVYDAAQKFEGAAKALDGVIPDSDVDRDAGVSGQYNHSYLMMGYDHAEKMFIMRDQKSIYSFNGYVKISEKALQKNFKKFGFISVDVLSVKPVKDQRTNIEFIRRALSKNPTRINEFNLSTEKMLKLIKLDSRLWEYIDKPAIEIQRYMSDLGDHVFFSREDLKTILDDEIIDYLVKGHPAASLIIKRLSSRLTNDQLESLINSNPHNIQYMSSPSKHIQFVAVKLDISVFYDNKQIKWDPAVVEYAKNKKVTPLDLNLDFNVRHLHISDRHLTTLKGIPTDHDYSSIDAEENLIESLDGSPPDVKDFNCSSNPLTDLVGGPINVNYYDCHGCKLTSLIGAPKTVVSFRCGGNPLTSLEHAPRDLEEMRFGATKITSAKGIYKHFDHCEEMYIGSGIKSHVLDFLLVPGLTDLYVSITADESLTRLARIINKFLPVDPDQMDETIKQVLLAAKEKRIPGEMLKTSYKETV